jgi:hypothetical protein
MAGLDALYLPVKCRLDMTSGLEVMGQKPIPKMLQIGTSAPMAVKLSK